MSVFIALCSLLVLVFGFVVWFGAPYVPTLSERTQEALDMLDLKPGQTLLELGSGDGRVLNAAAARGIKAIGYELNPLLVIWTKLKYRKNHRLITVHWGNYWRHQLPVTEGMYVFLLDKYMKKLDTKVTQEITNSVKLVSYAFKIPGRTPVQEKNGLYLYEYKPDTKNG